VVSQSGNLPTAMFDSLTAPILITSARGAGDSHRQTRCEVIISGDDTVDLADAVARLRERGLTRVLCEGGPTVLDELVAANAVDELCVTMAPQLAGCQPLGRGLPAGINSPIALRLEQALLGPDDYLYLRYARATHS
jgi:riboflavin biosynthesis pyrimidine reductase